MAIPPARPDAPPALGAALAVCAHPDDETFGLGAVLAALVDGGAAVEALCFTRGDASTLGQPRDLHPLADARATELAGAAQVLGLLGHELLAYPDGHLAGIPVAELAAHVVTAARRQGTDLLVVFDEGGVTGHPDHQRATDAALAAAHRLDLGVLAWAVREPVAAALNAELGTGFRGPRRRRDRSHDCRGPRSPTAGHRLPPQPVHRQPRAAPTPPAHRPDRIAPLAPPTRRDHVTRAVMAVVVM
jgi:LmbE family N-acetylglucosaminyl deacetylase